MSDLQIKKTSKSYDVCIVGSGAGGGMAVYILKLAGEIQKEKFLKFC